MKKVLVIFTVMLGFILTGCNSTKEEINKFGLMEEDAKVVIEDAENFISYLEDFIYKYESDTDMNFIEERKNSKELCSIATDNIYDIEGFDLGFGDSNNVTSEEGEELLSSLLSYYAELDGCVANIKIKNSENNELNIEKIKNNGFEFVDLINKFKEEIKE